MTGTTLTLFLKATPTVAREVLASAMPLIERLLVEHLEEDPLAVFDNAVWQKLLTNQEVFEAQQARCLETFENIVWASELAAEAVEDLRCDQCGSTLIRQAGRSRDRGPVKVASQRHRHDRTWRAGNSSG